MLVSMIESVVQRRDKTTTEGNIYSPCIIYSIYTVHDESITTNRCT